MKLSLELLGVTEAKIVYRIPSKHQLVGTLRNPGFHPPLPLPVPSVWKEVLVDASECAMERKRLGPSWVTSKNGWRWFSLEGQVWDMVLRFFFLSENHADMLYIFICNCFLNLLWIDPWFTINPTFLVSPISNKNQFRHAKETHFSPSSFTSTTALMTPPPKKRHNPQHQQLPIFCLFFVCAFLLFGSHDFLKTTSPQKNTWQHLDPFFSRKYLSILIKYQKTSWTVLYFKNRFVLKQTCRNGGKGQHTPAFHPCGPVGGRGSRCWSHGV